MIEANFDSKAVVKITASHVCMIKVQIAQINVSQPYTRHLKWFDRRVDDLQELAHGQFSGVTLAYLIQLGDQWLDAIEADFLVKLINQLSIVYRKVSVAISQIVEYIPKVRAVSIDEISSILVSRCIVAPREHHSEHR